MNRLGRFLHRRHLEERLDAELRFDFDERVAAKIRTGMDESQARRAVRIEFGGIEQLKEECRDVRGLQFVESLLQDVRYALRGIGRSPGFTVSGVATLAVAIGMNAAVFTIVNAVLFKGFPGVERNDRIVYISSRSYGCCVSYPDYEDWRAQAKSFEGLGAVRGIGVVLTDRIGAEHFDATQVTANAFVLLGRKPVIGRDFTPADERPGAPAVAVLSFALWHSRYAEDPAIVGRTVRVNGATSTVIGVMPRGFSFPQKQELWVPLTPTPEVRKRESRSLWFVFGRMAEGVTLRGARVEMDTLGKRLTAAYPLTNKDQPPVVQTFAEFFIGRNAAAMYGSMWGAVCCVLLIACANLANLMLARANGRSREIFVRVALGAGRRRIVRQMLIESLLLSVLSGVMGWGIARAGVHGYRLAAAHMSPWLIVDYSVDYRVLGYFVAIAIGTGLLFGMAPAARLWRVDVNTTLKDGGRGALGARRGRLSSVLLVAETALAVVLLISAGVMIRSFLNLYTADPGIKADHLLTADLALPDVRYSDATRRISFFDRLRKRLESIPGVESTALADRLPTSGSQSFPYELEDASPSEGHYGSALWTVVVSPGYFRTMGSAVLAGREFTEGDRPSSERVAIVNERFAAWHWPGRNPSGKRLRLLRRNKPGEWMTVVGVSANIAQNGITRRESDPAVYLPYAQDATADMWVFVRTRVAPGSLTDAFRREMNAADSELAPFGPFLLTDRLNTWNYWSNGILGGLFATFAATALLLAAVGLYAITAHSVSRRTQEIGVRMAIGAASRDIRNLVLREGMLPLGLGVALGWAAALAVTPVLRSSLVRVSPADPVAFAAAPAILVVAALLGCLIPARRAMRVDPLMALRHE